MRFCLLKAFSIQPVSIAQIFPPNLVSLMYTNLVRILFPSSASQVQSPSRHTVSSLSTVFAHGQTSWIGSQKLIQQIHSLVITLKMLLLLLLLTMMMIHDSRQLQGRAQTGRGIRPRQCFRKGLHQGSNRRPPNSSVIFAFVVVVVVLIVPREQLDQPRRTKATIPP